LDALWASAWESSPRYESSTGSTNRQLFIHSINPSSTLSRPNCSLIVQLRTRMIGVNAWLFKIHRAESPLCQTCQPREDVPHYIFFCSRFAHHRTSLRTALGRKATSVGYLLTDEKGIRHLLRYIHVPTVYLFFATSSPEPDTGT
ncbi:hypothetical protein B0H13DRAFT_1603622, partial [Mycena leptocephala]